MRRVHAMCASVNAYGCARRCCARNGLACRAFKAEDAVDVYKQCLRLDPLYPNALTNLGLAWESLGNHAEAEQCYRRSLRADGDDPETLELLGRCLSTRGKHKVKLCYSRGLVL